jgi:hypothetical protein
MGENREGTILTTSPWPVRLAARMLDPDEREIVLGDIAESRTPTGRAACDILGLAIRRQVNAWGDWQPWFALVYLAIPLGLLLGIVSRFWADDAAQTIHLTVINWNGPLFRNPGGREYVVELTTRAVLHCAALVVWSYACGRALVVLSRRTSSVNALFFVACVFIAVVGTTTTARANAMNVGFDHAIYGVALPLLIRVVAVILPAGVALITARLVQSAGWTVVCAVASLAATVLTLRGIESSLFFGWVVEPARARPFDVAPVLSGQWLPGPDGVAVSADDILGWRLRMLPLLTLFPSVFTLTAMWWRCRVDLSGSSLQLRDPHA